MKEFVTTFVPESKPIYLGFLKFLKFFNLFGLWSMKGYTQASSSVLICCFDIFVSILFIDFNYQGQYFYMDILDPYSSYFSNEHLNPFNSFPIAYTVFCIIFRMITKASGKVILLGTCSLKFACNQKNYDGTTF